MILIPLRSFTGVCSELCGIEFAKPLINWLKEKIPDGKFEISFNYKFVYKEDGSRLEIPRELFSCGECSKKMIEKFKFKRIAIPTTQGLQFIKIEEII